MTHRIRSRCRVVAAVAVAGLLAAACAGGGGGGAGGENQSTGAGTGKMFQVGYIGAHQNNGTPKRGGTVTIGAYSEATSLDPTKTYPTGYSGGIALAAVYDVLMRYDPKTGDYSPQLAKSLTHSGDYRTWTLTLRKGVTFSDGSPLDARAVVWSINRYVTNHGQNSLAWRMNVASMKATGPRTVVFTLKRTWSGFVNLLSQGFGMIVARSSVKGGTFTPIGAGPFALDHYAPQEELVLKARDDYWDGRPYLDTLRFVWLNGGATTLDSLQKGGIQAAFLNDPEVIVRARNAGYPGYMTIQNASSTLAINNRKGRPGSDLRVREAIAYAINDKVVNQRTYHGHGLPGKELYPQTSRWHNDVQPLPYDPDKATKLLRQAKADGYDGKISIMGNQSPTGKAEALAIKALLNKVGFDATLDLTRNVTQSIQRLNKHDFDVAEGGLALVDAAPYVRLLRLSPKSFVNFVGYDNPRMMQLIRALQTATTDETKRQAIAKIQRHWNETVPTVILAARPAFLAWQDNVHGVVPNTYNTYLFGNAWISSS